MRLCQFVPAAVSLLFFCLSGCSGDKHEAPKIILNGAEIVSLKLGQNYTEFGASVKDGTGQEQQAKHFDNVDISRIGTYGVTYYHQDQQGHLIIRSRRVIVSGPNLLAGKNPQVFKKDKVIFDAPIFIFDKDSHTDDGSGSWKLQAAGKDAYGKALTTASFKLQQDHHYTVRAYIKMLGAPRGQNLLVKISKKDDYKIFQEMYWNVAEPGEWEEVVLPFVAPVSGEYVFSFFLYKHSYSTDDQTINSERSNMADNPVIYFDDFSVVESKRTLSNETYTVKQAFESSDIRIDELGNWSVKERGTWQHIFPKLTYRDWMGNFEESAMRFKQYGFTGIVNIASFDHLKIALSQGLSHNGIQINTLSADDKKFILEMKKAMRSKKLSSTAVITYSVDNESTFMGGHYQEKRDIAGWIDQYDQDPATKKRTRPIFVLNGVAEGLTRNLKNSHSNVMDVTGSYMAQHGEAADIRYNPISTLSQLRHTHQQIAPVSIMALQSYYHATFVPMIFKGIGDGAKGLKFWRGGTTHNGSKKDFRQNVWAPAIKGDDGVFARIDKMLPIIRESLDVDWSATIPAPQSKTISMGLRDYQDKHYLILANFSDEDQQVDISLGGIYVTQASDFFSGEVITEIENGKFRFTIAHFNDGYKVIELR